MAITVTRFDCTPRGTYLYQVYLDGKRTAGRFSSHRFPVALVTPDAQYFVLIPRSQQHRADPSRVLVEVTDAS